VISSSLKVNKSPKLTPTRTDFTSKAAAAQLSSPLTFSLFAVAVSVHLGLQFWRFAAIADLRFAKVYGFFRSTARGSVLGFSGISPVVAATGFHQLLQRQLGNSFGICGFPAFWFWQFYSPEFLQVQQRQPFSRFWKGWFSPAPAKVVW